MIHYTRSPSDVVHGRCSSRRDEISIPTYKEQIPVKIATGAFIRMRPVESEREKEYLDHEKFLSKTLKRTKCKDKLLRKKKNPELLFKRLNKSIDETFYLLNQKFRSSHNKNSLFMNSSSDLLLA